MNVKLMTLCIVHQHPKILLAMKKRGFGKDRWNGFGGKVKEEETIEQAMLRELKEEGGIVTKDHKKVAILDFEFPNHLDINEIFQVHIFKASEIDGEPQETEEMRPEWFEIDKIPFDSMWADDIHWLPLFLADKIFKGRFVFDNNDQIIEHFLEEVKFLE